MNDFWISEYLYIIQDWPFLVLWTTKKSYRREISPGYESPSGAVCYHGLPHTDYSRLGRGPRVQPLIWELGAPKSWSFPISFPWFSYLFHGFPIYFPWFSWMFPWFSYIFSMVFLSFLVLSYGISTRPRSGFFVRLSRGHAEACSIQLDDVRGERARSQVGRVGLQPPSSNVSWKIIVI